MPLALAAMVPAAAEPPAKPADQAAEIASQEWRSYVSPLLSIGERLVPQLSNSQDPELRRELYRGIFSQLSTAYLGLMFADPQHPDFWPFITPAYNYAGPNPDDDYYLTPIEDTGVYKISGFRGTVKRVDFQIGTGTFMPRGVMDENKLGLTLANHDLDSLAMDKDGAFDVILSPTRPAGYTGNWWPLSPKATYLLVRQISYDWINEVDGRFAIERLDRAAAKPRPTAAELEANLRQIAKWTESTVQFSLNFTRGLYKDQGINKMAYKDLRQYGEIVTQKYAYGGFDLAPDEALIVEAKVPQSCRYWGIHLMDDAGFALDWVNRQTILNGYTAVVDKDGVFRAVISARDPGVRNWLDTMGYQTGAIQARWEGCSSWPDHKVIKVKAADVGMYLPADTATISAEARENMIRLRRRAVQMRKRW